MDPVLFSSGATGWETPPDLFEALDEQFHFTLDTASSNENRLCAEWYVETDNALDRSWETRGSWWCNPPYGRTLKAWIEKALYEQSQGHYGVMLLPARTDTRWFHLFWGRPGIQTIFLKGRLRFLANGKELEAAPFPSMLVYFGPSLQV